MEKTKKSLLIASLVALAVTCIFFILAIFGVEVFNGIAFRLLLIFASLSVGFAFLTNEINVLTRNKILGIFSISFLSISLLFALIIFSTPLLENGSIFNTITAIVALFSTFFMIVISLATRLEKRLLVLQIITYAILLLLEVLFSILIAGFPLFKITAMTEIFSVICVISVGLLIALWILSTKKTYSIEKGETDKEYIKVLKKDYDKIIEENNNLKQQIQKLTKKD